MHIHVLTIFFLFLFNVDIPLTAIFGEENGHNSSQLHEQRGEEKSTELQENVSVRKDDKGQEEKEREKEDGERLVQLLVSSLYLNFRLNKLNASKNLYINMKMHRNPLNA